MRAVAVIAILAALGLGAWNWWQVRELRGEVAAGAEANADSAAKYVDEARDLIDRAQEAMAQVAAHLEAGETQEAREALDLAMRNLDAAAQLLKDDEDKGGILEAIRGALSKRLSKDKPGEEGKGKSPKGKDGAG
jgi:uncharacterized protein HemX